MIAVVVVVKIDSHGYKHSISMRHTLGLFSISGHYQALGRSIHARYLRERLEEQTKLNFKAERKTMDVIQQLDILADTLYIQVDVLNRLRPMN